MGLHKWRLLPGVALVCMIGSANAAPELFETRLAPAPLTNGTRADVAGEGRVHATLDGTRLDVEGDYHGLKSNATTARIYIGLGIGVMGTRAFDISATPAMAGTISGTVTLTSKQVAALRSGKFYILVSSEKAPDGNLIGWLLPPHPFAGEDVPVPGHGFLPQLDVPRQP